MGKLRLEKTSTEGCRLSGNPWHLYQEQGAQSKLEESSSELAWLAFAPLPSVSCLLIYLVPSFAAVTDTNVLFWTLASSHWTPGGCLGLHLEPSPDLSSWSWCYIWVCWHCSPPPGSSGGLSEPHLCWCDRAKIAPGLSLPERYVLSTQTHCFPWLISPAEWKRRFEYWFWMWTIKWVWAHFSFGLSHPFALS